MNRGARALLTSLVFFVRLPQLAGAGPLVLELDVQRPFLDEAAEEAIVDGLHRFEAVLSHGDSANFAGLFDATRGGLLLRRLADDGRNLSYESTLQAWCRGAANPSDAAEDLRRRFQDAARLLLPAVPCVNVSYSDREWVRALDRPGPGIAPRERHGERRDAHPLLGEMLILSCLGELPWSDPRCAPWRGVVRDMIAPACPLLPGVGPFDLDLWATQAIRRAWVDSVIADTPAIAQANWLKRKLARAGLGAAVGRMRLTLGAFEEMRRQARGDFTGAAPLAVSPPPRHGSLDRAVLRLVFLPDSRSPRRWRLAAAYLSPLRDDAFGPASREPGFTAWLARYAVWHEEVMARVETAAAQR